MHPLTLFDSDDACGCRDASDTCCAAAALDALRSRGPGLLEIAAGEGLSGDRLAAMLLATTARPRDPLAVPDGWRLYNGQLVADPQAEAALSHGTLPVQQAEDRAHDASAVQRLAGLLLAGRQVLAGLPLRLDQRVLGGLAQRPGRLELAATTPLAEFTHVAARAHHVWLGGRHLSVPAPRRCPTTATAAALPVAVHLLAMTAAGRLPTLDGAGIVMTGTLVEADLGAEGADALLARAAVRLGGGAGVRCVRSRLVSVTRDLAGAGRPILVGVAWLDRPAPARLRALAGAPEHAELAQLAVPTGADGQALQAQAATSGVLDRTRRGVLDVVGAALREGRLRPGRA